MPTNFCLTAANDAGVTPALRRRRERAERQRSFIREQQESAAILRATLDNNKQEEENGKCFGFALLVRARFVNFLKFMSFSNV